MVMKNLFHSRPKSLKLAQSFGWIIFSGVVTLVALVILLAFYRFQVQAQSNSIVQVLNAQFEYLRNPVYRQIVGANGTDNEALDALIAENRRDLGLAEIVVRSKKDCTSVASCLPNSNSLVWYAGDVGTDDLVLIIAREKPPISSVPFVILTLTIGMIIFVGVSTQQKFLNHYVFKPCFALLECIKTNQTITQFEGWPTELVNMYSQQRELLEERDKSIIAAEIARLEEVRTADYASFAHTLLHLVKAKLINIKDIVTGDAHIPDTTKAFIFQLIDTPQLIIQKALKDYTEKMKSLTVNASPTMDLHELSNVSTIGVSIHAISKEYYELASRNGIDFNIVYPTSLLSCFCKLRSDEIYSAIHNIVNNGFDSVASSTVKRVSVSFGLVNSEGRRESEILIKDSGPPFTREALESIAFGGRFSSKPNGNGCGVQSAIETLRKIHGTLSISEIDKVVKLRIPLVQQPEWIFDIMKVTGTVLVLDDDQAILAKLRESLVYADLEKLFFYSNEADFLASARIHPTATLLVDFDYQGARNGLDLIHQEQLAARAVLLSGLIPNDATLVKRAIDLGIKVYPKESVISMENRQ